MPVALTIIARHKPKRRTAARRQDGKRVVGELRFDQKLFDASPKAPWEKPGISGITVKENRHVTKFEGGVNWLGVPDGRR